MFRCFGKFVGVVSLVAFALGQLAGCSANRPTTGSGAGKPGSPGSAAASANGAAAGRGASTGSGAGDTCSTPGATRGCCGTGTQTCDGTVEFQIWGPCLDTKGATLSCAPTSGCGIGEFGPNCDGGVGYDSGHKCGDGEFGPGCGSVGQDAGRACGPGEFGPACDSGKLCTDATANNEPEILVGYLPAAGESVSQCGQVKVWVNDEWPPFIAPGEQVDPSTGMVTTPGDRTATAPDGLLYEPALYLGSGFPLFPVMIKGWYNSDPQAFVKMKGPPSRTAVTGVQGAPIDAPPPGTQLSEKYAAEYIWDLCSLGLPPGTYTAEFIVADGDRNRAIGCVTIVVTP